EFHKKTGAIATVIVSHSDEPCRYGNLCYDKSGKITNFYEKPEWKNVKSDVISTGIYVLSPRIFDYIPRDGACDFAKDVFPKLDGGALYAYDAGGYFLDIGTPEAYLKANFDAARGLIKTITPSSDIENVISPRAKVSRGAMVSGSVIMEGAVICDGASVYNSIVCRGAVVKSNAYVSNAVVPPHTSVSGDGGSPLGKIKLENERVSGETADEISPDSARAKHVFTGTVNAPYGAAKTLGELISRGAEDTSDGVKLDFDGGSATLFCSGKNSVVISASAENPEYAEKIFSYAENGLENLF
ncbi:MAG: NDP-sugar synthase, partial [Clostridiales bacterium]|nr:NDP-sugar synthase [Clostridiales bacterium]